MKIAENTKFIYIMTSSNELEPRFIVDITRCSILNTIKGVPFSSQVVVTDMPKDDLIAKQKFFSNFDIVNSAAVYDTVRNIECDNLFIITSCHGLLYGIDAIEIIRPFDLTEAIKQNPHITNCVALFGQCYAGIFNHLDLSYEGKNIVYIGAAEMRTGLSVPLSWTLNGNKWQWCANIFVYYLASWLYSPDDVDHDGHFTIVDLFKFVSYYTNIKTENVEKEEAKKYWAEAIKAEIDKIKPSEEDSTEIEELDKEATEELDYIIPHQDCWILNTDCAIKMIIE